VSGQTQINIRNEHMQYILTWYALTAATLVMWVFVKPSVKAPKSMARRLPPVLRS
jgi:surfeit locus 1 family protein